MSDEKPEIKRDKRGLFAKGYSANPAGRKKGSGIVGEYRRRLQEKLPEVVEVLIQRTLDGDPVSTKLYLERVMPALKPEYAPVALDTPEQARLSELGVIVIRSIASGEISPDQGAVILSGLASQAKIVEVDDLTKRLEALEYAQGKSNEEQQ